MAQKYLPTNRDRKATERFQRQQSRRVPVAKPAAPAGSTQPAPAPAAKPTKP